jgi:hypothetical protein
MNAALIIAAVSSIVMTYSSDGYKVRRLLLPRDEQEIQATADNRSLLLYLWSTTTTV